MTTKIKQETNESNYSDKVQSLFSRYGETVAQGMAFALGGLIMNGIANKYRTPKQVELTARDENVLSFDRAANS